MNSVLKLIILLFIPIIFSSAHAMTIVCIVGGTGAGKTTIAKKLVENMGDRVAIISQDSYYKDLSHLTKDERKK